MRLIYYISAFTLFYMPFITYIIWGKKVRMEHLLITVPADFTIHPIQGE